MLLIILSLFNVIQAYAGGGVRYANEWPTVRLSAFYYIFVVTKLCSFIIKQIFHYQNRLLFSNEKYYPVNGKKFTKGTTVFLSQSHMRDLLLFLLMDIRMHKISGVT